MNDLNMLAVGWLRGCIYEKVVLKGRSLFPILLCALRWRPHRAQLLFVGEPPTVHPSPTAKFFRQPLKSRVLSFDIICPLHDSSKNG